MDRWPLKPQVVPSQNGGVLVFVGNAYKELSPQQAIKLGTRLMEVGRQVESATAQAEVPDTQLTATGE